MTLPPPLVLATSSPRRLELVGALGMPFRILHVRFRETMPSLPPEEAARMLAWRKVETAGRGLARGVIVTADTLVALDGRLYGKPRSPRDAASMLAQLSGRTHQVVTAVAIQDARTRHGMLGSERTEVTFRRLSPATIRRYVAGGEPLDKAGAYGIQGEGRRLVARITGDYLNVVGFPLRLFAALARRFGVPVPGRTVSRLYAERRPVLGAGSARAGRG